MDYQAVTAAVAHLLASTTEDSPVEVLLSELCHAAVGLLDVDDVHLLVLHEERPRFLHATTRPPAATRELEEALRAGPCRDAVETGQVVVARDRAELEPWPLVSMLDAGTGVHALVAAPLTSRGRAWGALVASASRPTDWSDDQLAVLRLLADGTTARLVVQSDRNEALLAKIQLGHQSTHDSLTGLGNRVMLFDRLEHMLATAPSTGTTVAALFVDLDEFAQVNEMYGHRAGDHALREVGQRLIGLLRTGDMVARLGSDEFVVLVDQLPTADEHDRLAVVHGLAERIHRALAAPLMLEAGTVHLTAHVGAAVAGGTMSAEELVDEADHALFETRGRPPGSVSVRDFSLPLPRVPVEAERVGLARALDREHLAAHYQLIVDSAAPHRTVAVEALMRWTDRDGVIVPASSFIDAASRQGLMPAFGAWIANQACAQLGQWRTDLGDLAPERVFVNLSARELNDPTLPDTLASAAERHDLEASQLGLEIIEESFVHPGLVHRLAELRRRGHQLAIDDFGTGYSSLSRLIDVPVDVVKIDHDFVAGLPGDRRRAGLVEAVVAIARTLEVKVVAEGVETVEQRDLLAGAGVDLLQGYLFGHPSPGDEVFARSGAGDHRVLVRHVISGDAAVVQASQVSRTLRRWFERSPDDVLRAVDELEDALVERRSTRRLENYLGVEVSRP
ncbi:MAG: GGDEF domain-containing protein [Nocardioidaceae bacterium]|nr:GGDEF domain-containing protein [Nocardioidaceae bacterium]